MNYLREFFLALVGRRIHYAGLHVDGYAFLSPYYGPQAHPIVGVYRFGFGRSHIYWFDSSIAKEAP